MSQHNPKKGKSAERYEAYKAATTAREYVALGGSKADLKYDIQRGYVTVLPPPAGAEGAPMASAPAVPTGPRPSLAGAPAVAVAATGSRGLASASVSATAPAPPTSSTDPVSYLPETPVWPAADDAVPARADGPGSSMPPAAKS